MPYIDTLQELLIDELKDLHHAEQQLIIVLPKMASAASNPELKQEFFEHLEETKRHVERLELAFRKLGAPVQAKSCKAMDGLIEEGTAAVNFRGPDALRDACLIGAAQRVEHYEISAYGTARAFAQMIGENEVAGLLQDTLEEEGATDRKLTNVAETVNDDAYNAGRMIDSGR